MNEMFSQGGKGSTGILTNKQAIARKFGVKQNEVVYFAVGVDLGGYKVIYDKETQRAYSLPADIAPGTTAVSLNSAGVLVHSVGNVDLGALAVTREEYITLPGSFTKGGVVNTKNELLVHTDGAYRWDGALPKTVEINSTPIPYGVGGWIGVGAIPLRKDLASPTGANLIGFQQADSGFVPRTIQDKLREFVSVKEFGAKGDNLTDDTVSLVNAITYCATNGHTLIWPKGQYRFSAIDIAIPYGYFNWITSGKVELICTNNVVGTAGQAIKLGGVASPTLHNFTTRDIGLGEKTITLDSVSDISVGDLLVIRNNHVVRGDNRGSWQEGQIVEVVSLSGNNVTLDQDAYYYYRSGGNITVTVTSASSGQSFTSTNFSVTSPPRDALYKILGLTGDNAGITKMVTAYDDDTKTFTIGSNADTGFPNKPAAGDTFRLVRQAEAWAVYPATFNISGDFHVGTTHGLVTNATSGQKAYDGVVFEYCVNGIASFASVENFPNAGITLLGCLRCTVRDTSLYGINRVFNGDGGTGNAVSVSNSSYCTVDNINASCCRRGVDIGGSNWSALYNNVTNITMRGGGTGYTGGIIFPSEGWTEFSYGFGSHGGAAESKYKDNVAVDCFYGATIRGFNEIVSGCEIRGFSNIPIRLYYGSGITITDTHYIDGFTETTGSSNKWWKSTNSVNRKLRPGAFILMTPTYTLETPTIIKGCSAKSTTREFVIVDTNVVAPGKIDGVLLTDCTAYVDNFGATSGNTDAYMLRINGGPSLGDNFGFGGGNQMILVGTNNTVNSGKLFHASGTCEGAIRKSEGVWEMRVKGNTSQSLPVTKSSLGYCVDVINNGVGAFYSGLNMLLQTASATDNSPMASINKMNLVVNASDVTTPTKMGISIVNGRLYFNNGTAQDVVATVRVGSV